LLILVSTQRGDVKLIDWKNTQESRLFTDVWNLYKQYHSLTQDSKDDSKWSYLVAEGNAIIKKYDNSQFAVELTEAVLNQIERASKGVS
jgi:hypothetical protein